MVEPVVLEVHAEHPVEAFRRARTENKLVFMVHLSGNFEDKDCT